MKIFWRKNPSFYRMIKVQIFGWPANRLKVLNVILHLNSLMPQTLCHYPKMWSLSNQFNLLNYRFTQGSGTVQSMCVRNVKWRGLQKKSRLTTAATVISMKLLINSNKDLEYNKSPRLLGWKDREPKRIQTWSQNCSQNLHLKRYHPQPQHIFTRSQPIKLTCLPH